MLADFFLRRQARRRRKGGSAFVLRLRDYAATREVVFSFAAISMLGAYERSEQAR